VSASRTSFEKLQRDRAKKEKAAAKRDRRQERGTEDGAEGEDTSPPTDGRPVLSTPEILKLVEELHQQFEDEQISHEELEKRRTELLSQLTVE
jgi:hypothetical protein